MEILETMKSRSWPNESTLDSISIFNFIENTLTGKACANINLIFTGKATLPSRKRRDASIFIDIDFFDNLVTEIKAEIVAAVQEVSNDPDSKSILPTNIILSTEDIGDHAVAHSYSVVTTQASGFEIYYNHTH